MFSRTFFSSQKTTRIAWRLLVPVLTGGKWIQERTEEAGGKDKSIYKGKYAEKALEKNVSPAGIENQNKRRKERTIPIVFLR